LNYATFLEDTSDPGSAIEIYEKYEQLYGPDPKVLLDMARLYEELGQRTRACEKYREVLRSRPQGDLERGLREKFQTLCGNGGAR
jgi:tetratricopeptide (TPR) repeat protein